MTPDLQHVLGRYIDCGWVDAHDSRSNEDTLMKGVRPAYLLLSSLGTSIQPLTEVQVTTRCYWSFRAHKMVVAEDSGRFNLTDLKINYQSQFMHAQAVLLREHVARVRGVRQEVRPDPIRWPLNVCAWGSEVSALAIIPEGREEDPGAEFEVVLLGEVVFS
jgi:hypothetical protein